MVATSFMNDPAPNALVPKQFETCHGHVYDDVIIEMTPIKKLS